MAVCLSHGGPNLYRSSVQDSQLLVGTLNGITVLDRQGGGWRVAGRTLDGMHISALMIEPGRGRLFAGTHKGGLYASDDGGRTWQLKNAGIAPDNFYVLGYSQAAGKTKLYAGTEPAHLYVSEDLGEHWQELPALRSVPSVDRWTFPGEPHVAHVKSIEFDPRDPDTIYAAVEVGGLFKSTDGGQSWQELSGFYEDVHRVMISPQAPDQVYIATGDGVYRSADAGATWQRLTSRDDRIAYPDGLILHPERRGLAFISGAICGPGEWRRTHDADARVGQTLDGGQSWQMLAGGLPDHIRGNIEALSMNVWPGGFALFAGTTDGDVFASEDGGRTWRTIASGLPPVSKGGHYRNLQTPDSPRELVGAH